MHIYYKTIFHNLHNDPDENSDIASYSWNNPKMENI